MTETHLGEVPMRGASEPPERAEENGCPVQRQLRALRVALGGARGVGKTTVLSTLQRLCPEVGVVHVSRELVKLAGQRGMAGFRTLSPAMKAELRSEFAHTHAIAAAGALVPTIFDLHYVDIDEGADCIQPHELLQHIDLFLLLQADLSTVLARRHDDVTRTRNLDPGHVAHEQDAELEMMIALARRYGRPHTQIDNYGPPEEVARRILRVLERLN